MSAIISLTNVSLQKGKTKILHRINWHMNPDERWVILGQNGAGKTSLVQIIGTLLFPSEGEVEVLGEILGQVDVFELRPRIGLSSSALMDKVSPEERVIDVVRTAAHGMTGTWREEYDEEDDARAFGLLETWQVEHLRDRQFGSLSEGERKRVLIARSLMSNPELLLLDEPAAGLDLGAREQMTLELARFANSQFAPVTLLVTHHVEEIPPGTTHVMLLKGGRIVAQGEIDDVLNSDNLSMAFDMSIDVETRDSAYGKRWSAWAT